MAAQILKPIDCSVQPLDISFHPSKHVVAAALVDGTVECELQNQIVLLTCTIF